MAFDKATLKSELQTAFENAVGVSDMGVAAQAIADAIDKYAKTGNATGVDAPTGDNHNLSLS